MTQPTAQDIENAQVVIRAAANIVLDTALRLIQADPHQWSERGCSTCRAVTQLAGSPFGCVLYARQRRAE